MLFATFLLALSASADTNPEESALFGLSGGDLSTINSANFFNENSGMPQQTSQQNSVIDNIANQNTDNHSLVNFKLTEEMSVYQLALQNSLTVEQLNLINDGKLKNKETLAVGEIVKLPSNSLMVKANKRSVDQQSDSKNAGSSTLPNLASDKSEGENDGILSKILDETPIGTYTKNDSEKNTALLAQDAATRDWENFNAAEIKKDVENWGKNYVDGKINAAKSKVLGEANSLINKPINDFLGRFGNAQFSLSVDEKGNVKASDFKLFSPLYDVEHNLVFGQVGVHKQGVGDESRLIGNFGLGYRYDTEEYLLGANTFIDHDFDGSNTRLGLGVEYWRDYLKLAANYYVPISKWKDSSVLLDFEERPAEGFDIRAQGYLPSYPQLGGSLVYEQYFGKEVALFGLDDRQKDPYAFTAGIDYTPVPAITTKASYKVGDSGRNEARLDLDFNLRMGIPLEEQFDPANVAAMRSLKGSRYDMVDRNYDIVFEYRAKQIQVQVIADPAQIFLGDLATLKGTTNSRSKITKLTWYVSDGINGWIPVADETNSSVALFNTYEPKGLGTYWFKLYVETETGATGISEATPLDVISPATGIDFRVVDNKSDAFVSIKSNWDAFSLLNIDSKFSQSYLKYEFLTPGEPQKVPPTIYYQVKGNSNWSIVKNSESNIDNSNSNESIISFIEPAGPELTVNGEGGYYESWFVYVIADDGVLGGKGTEDFSFKAQTVDEFGNQLTAESREQPGTFRLNVNPISLPGGIDLHIVDLGPINNINTRSVDISIDTVCHSIATDGSEDFRIIKTTIITKDGDNHYIASASRAGGLDRPIEVNHRYGVCIIDTDSIPNRVLNDELQDSIVWKYWDPNLNMATGQRGIQLPAQDANLPSSVAQQVVSYKGLEGCRTKTVFRTQTTNFRNNEFSWGYLGSSDRTELTEQGLQLSVQFNLMSLNDGIDDPLEKECYGYFSDNDSDGLNSDFIHTVAQASGFAEVSATADNNFDITKDDNQAYVGEWH